MADLDAKVETLTKRSALLKLELSGDAMNQIEKVAHTLFDIDIRNATLASNSLHWSATDDVLYREAKASYDGIIAAFTQEPKVYKLEATKEKVWEANRIAEEQRRLEEEEQKKTQETKSTKARLKPIKKADTETNLIVADDVATTFINPFTMTYATPSAAQIDLLNQRRVPVEVWADKLNLLERLTPREDLEGYEYRENVEERKAREAKQKLYQIKLRDEIQRREQNPTDIEQVEDCLFDIIENVCTRHEKALLRERVQEKKAIRSVYHPNTKGYKMKPLAVIESEDGSITKKISDIEFEDMIISVTGHMISIVTPPGLFEKFEEERRILAEAKRALEARIEAKKREPLSTKVVSALKLATKDPKAAAVQLMDDITDKAMTLPRKLKPIHNSKKLASQSKKVVVQGITSLLRLTQDPLGTLETLTSSLTLGGIGGGAGGGGMGRGKKSIAQLKAERTREFIDALNKDSKEERLRLKEATFESPFTPQHSPKPKKFTHYEDGKQPVEHADSVLVKLTLLLSPPPAYVMRPPKTWQRDFKRMSQLAVETAKHKWSTVKESSCGDREAVGGSVVSSIVSSSSQARAAAAVPASGDAGIDVLEPVPEQPENAPDEEEVAVADEPAEEDNDSEPAAESQPEGSSRPTTATAAAAAEVEVEVPYAAVDGDEDDLLKGLEEGMTGGGGGEKDGVEVGAGGVEGHSVLSQPTNISSTAVSSVKPIKRKKTPKEILDEEENINVKKILCHSKFDGHIYPKDMITKVARGLRKREKLVFDDSERRQFESRLVQELSAIVGLPVGNINLEEIRRLEPDNMNLHQLKQRSDEMMEHIAQLRAAERQKLLEERMFRKSLADGSYQRRFEEEREARLRLEKVLALTEAVVGLVEDSTLDLTLDLAMIYAVVNPLTPEELARELAAVAAGADAVSSTEMPSVLEGVEAAPADDSMGQVVSSSEQESESGTGGDGERSWESVSASGSVEASSGADSPIAHAASETKQTQETLSVKFAATSTAVASTVDRPEVPSTAPAAAVAPSVSTTAKTDLQLEGSLDDVIRTVTLADLLNSSVVEESTTLSDALPESSSSVLVNQEEATGKPVVALDNNDTTAAAAAAVAADLPSRPTIEIPSDEEALTMPSAKKTTRTVGFAEPTLLEFSVPADEDTNSLANSNKGDGNVDGVQQNAVALSTQGMDGTLEVSRDPDSHQDDSVVAASSTASSESPIRVSLSQAVMPEAFKIGILNPQDLKYDPHYWLAKNLNDLSDEEKRQYRIARLRLMHQEDQVTMRMKQIAELKEQLLEDTLDYFAPLIEQVQPLVDVVRPYAVVANRELLKKATACFAHLNGVAAVLDQKGLKLENVSKLSGMLKTLKAVRRPGSGGGGSQRRSKKSPRAASSATDRDVIQLLLNDMLAKVESRVNGNVEAGSGSEEENLDFMQEIAKMKNEFDAEVEAEALLHAHDHDNAKTTAEGLEEEADEDDNGDDEDARSGKVRPASGAAAAVAADGSGEKEASGEDVAEADSREAEAAREELEMELMAAEDEDADEVYEDDEEEEEEEEEELDEEAAAEAEVLNSRRNSLARLQMQEWQALQELSAIKADALLLMSRQEYSHHLETLRQRRLAVYEPDIVDLLDQMCLSVELSEESAEAAAAAAAQSAAASQSVASAVSSIYDENDDDEEDEDGSVLTYRTKTTRVSEDYTETDHADKLFGCEISFMIFVNDEQRKLYGLSDIEAEDVGVLLKQQLYDIESPLYAGSILKHIVDVQYKLPFKKRSFTNWESFWVHIISPTFFGYSAHHHVQKLDRHASQRLESGLMIVNPVDSFTERLKLTFKALNERVMPVDPNEKRRRKQQHADILRDDDEASLASTVVDEGHQLNLETDDMAAELNTEGGKRLKLYRPNMEALTARDVLRLKRLHKAFEEQYEELMCKGLVDGRRLRPEQYQALKDRDSAYRIYRTAKAKYHRKHENTDELVLPPYRVTKIDHEIFEGWVEEVRQEDQERMRERRLKAAKMKEILKQQAELRRTAMRAKMFIIDRFISQSSDPLDIEREFHAEMQKRDLQADLLARYDINNHAAGKENASEGGNATASAAASQTDKIMEDIRQARLKVKMDIISEEKKTRRLFAMVNEYSTRYRNVNFPKFLRQATALGRLSEEEGGVPLELTDLTLEVPSTPVSTAFGGASERTPSRGGGSRGDGKPDTARSHASTAPPTPSASSAAGTSGAGVGETTKPGLEKQSTSVSLLSSKTEETEEPAEEDNTSVPILLKSDLYHFLSVCHKAIRAHEEQLALEAKYHMKENKRLARERRLKTMMISQTNTAKYNKGDVCATTPTAAASEDDDSESEDEDEEGTNGETGGGGGGSGDVPSAEGSVSEYDDVRIDQEELDYYHLQEGVHDRAVYVPLSQKEFEFVLNVKWIKTLMSTKNYYPCLKELPTLNTDSFARDELIQYAATLSEVAPIFARIIADIEKAKEDAEIAMGLRKKGQEAVLSSAAQRKKEREEKKKARLEEKLKEQGKHEEWLAQKKREAEEKAAEERRIALENLRKQAEREKAWFMAHPHKFIKHKDEVAFCIVCKEKEFEYWTKLYKEGEKEWRGKFDNYVLDLIAAREECTRKALEENDRERLQKKAEKLVTKDMLLEAKSKSIMGSATSSSFKFSALISSEKKDDKPKAEEEEWEVVLARLMERLENAGLALCDCNGVSILPKEPEKKIVEEKFVAPEVVDDQEMSRALEDALQCKIRVWHRDTSGNRANFLGMVLLDEKVLKRPPKGMRTYPLMPDPAVVEAKPLEITGSIQIKVSIQHNEHTSGVNTQWRVDLLKMAGNVSVDPNMYSNPYCEIYWVGPAEKKREATFTDGWVLCAQTKHRESTLNIEFNREEDNSCIELPPLWTDKEIPNRGFNEMDVCKGGGWITRDRLKEIKLYNDEDAIKERLRKQAELEAEGKSKKFQFGAKSPAEVRKFKETVKFNELLTQETQSQLEIIRYKATVEETERRAMAREERAMRSYTLQAELTRSRPLMIKQTEYSRQFMRLLQLVQSPPNILSRVRFLMGQESQGSGMKVMSEDPATGNVFTILTIPILYAEDENLLTQQMSVLIGKACSNLTKIVDYSVHQIRDFNFNGFTSVDERNAIVILEYYEGVPVLKYLLDNWNTVTNDIFRDILCQIMNGLKNLHEEGILHRNLSPDCVVLELPNTKPRDRPTVAQRKAERNGTALSDGSSVASSSAVVAAASPTKSARDRMKINRPLVEKINCRLGEYLFLHNPRKPNCPTSLGRADWGQKETAPPESLNSAMMGGGGAAISDKSDIYAFGALAYYWATGGRHWLPPDMSSNAAIEGLKTSLPLKWGKWLHSLLVMCLQRQPQQRASAKEVHLFLNSRFGK